MSASHEVHHGCCECDLDAARDRLAEAAELFAIDRWSGSNLMSLQRAVREHSQALEHARAARQERQRRGLETPEGGQHGQG